MFALTPRLTLRPCWPEEAEALHAAICDWEVARMLSRLPWPYSLAHAEAWLTRAAAPGECALTIFTRDGGPPRLIGGIGLHPQGQTIELGYWLTRDAWGRGYASEAGRAMLEIAQHAMGLARITSGHFADNPASGRVLAKLGFTPAGSELRPCLARGSPVECVLLERYLGDAAPLAVAA